MYVSRNTTGLGVANEWEGVEWTMIVSFDPAAIADYLLEEAVCTTDDCPGFSMGGQNIYPESFTDGQHFVGDPVNTRSGVFSFR